jgi:lipopolysaccharide transport system permease protein
MLESLRAKDLLLAWTGRTLRARYQQSVLGWLWAVLQPAAQTAVFTFIFTHFVPVNTGSAPYLLFSYVAMVPWTFLSASLSDMTGSLVNNMSLLTKIYFPREVLPMSAMLARLMDLGVAAALLAVLIAYYQIPLFAPALLYLPVLLLTQTMLVLGLGFAAASTNVFYRDVQPLLTLVLQLWFYASPVIYPISAVPERFRALYFLNPMAGLIQSYRDVLLEQRAPGAYFIGAISISVTVFIAGHALFVRLERQFADIV